MRRACLAQKNVFQSVGGNFTFPVTTCSGSELASSQVNHKCVEMAKSPLEESEEVSEVSHPSPSAKIDARDSPCRHCFFLNISASSPSSSLFCVAVALCFCLCDAAISGDLSGSGSIVADGGG